MLTNSDTSDLHTSFVIVSAARICTRCRIQDFRYREVGDPVYIQRANVDRVVAGEHSMLVTDLVCVFARSSTPQSVVD